jgi:poly(3-hydroxybutyrate) depolymerase
MNAPLASPVSPVVAGITAGLALSLCSVAAFAQPPGQGRGGFGLDPRAESRSYRFEDTGQDLPYCLYVSSKVSERRAAPLIVSLHGMGATPDIMCNTTAVDLAEEGGYILVSPMGYNTTGWYGSPVISMGGAGRGGAGRGAGRGAPPPAAAGNAPAPAAAGGGQAPGAARGAPPPAAAGGGRGGFGGGEQPENLAELSEKDVMNVLAMVREEFNVDDDRIYLTGHSMGGAGTYFLGSKHADIWAAVAPVAAASFMMDGVHAELLQELADAEVPIMVVHGAADEVVAVSNSQTWVATMDEIGMEHEYVELPGVTHGPVITASQEYIFEFFDKHSK